MTRKPAARPSIWISAASDVGAVRSRNEDGLWLVDRFLRDGGETRLIAEGATGPLFVAVADGVGGASAGDVASRFVLERVASAITSDRPDGGPLPDWLKSVASAVNRSLVMQGFHTGNEGMATTLTGVVLVGDSAVWINAGDSRLYSFSDLELDQVSRDHTLREQMADPRIPGNIITNCFGSADDFYMDVGDLELTSASTYLLCSDGLSDYTDHETLVELMSTAGSAPTLERFGEVPGQLVAAALEGGGGDNVSCLILRAVPS